MYHRVNNIDEEERLMAEMLKLQSQVRAQRETDRIAHTQRSQRYTKMFEPVTKSIEKLAAPPAVPATGDLLNLEPEPEPEPVKIEKDDLFEEPGELYRQALQQVPRKDRDDGTLGLNTTTHTIGDYIYDVEGDMLKVHRDGDQEQFVIEDLELWKLLLVKNPGKIRLQLMDEQKHYYPFVYTIKVIVDRLQLVALYENQRGVKNRIKYRLLMTLHEGSGFLFSVRPPTLRAGPDTVVIPSDSKGLMNELYTVLAELRAGNESMQNIIVPLAAEARRKNLLPPNLLSPEEETWVFA